MPWTTTASRLPLPVTNPIILFALRSRAPSPSILPLPERKLGKSKDVYRVDDFCQSILSRTDL